MDLLATPLQIGSMLVPNRLVRSATYEGLADHGQVTAELIEVIARLARGQVGTIVVGESAIAPDGGYGGTQIGLWHDETVSGLSRLVVPIPEPTSATNRAGSSGVTTRRRARNTTAADFLGQGASPLRLGPATARSSAWIRTA